MFVVVCRENWKFKKELRQCIIRIGCMSEWMDIWMNEWIFEWMNEWIVVHAERWG